MTLSESLNCTEPQFLHLKNAYRYPGGGVRIHGVTQVKQPSTKPDEEYHYELRLTEP